MKKHAVYELYLYSQTDTVIDIVEEAKVMEDVHSPLRVINKGHAVLGIIPAPDGTKPKPIIGENCPKPVEWSKMRTYCREAFSEFFGTMVLVLFGNGVVAQVVLSNGEKGDYQSISWGWGLGVMLGVYVSSISGSHLNPAVTFTFCILRRFSWRKFPVYALSQLLGGMSAAAIVYGNYKSAIDAYEGGAGIRTVPGYSDTASGVIFCTYPAEFMTRTGQFFSEFVASSILMFLIFALTDKGNLAAGQLFPLVMFFTVFGIGACFGWETGYAINLARDFGPRLVSYLLGYGTEVWTAGNYYFWVSLRSLDVAC
ncbi:aquaporin-like protein [Aspergillus unguis]